MWIDIYGGRLENVYGGKGKLAHGWLHIKRVRHYALKIAENYEVDEDVIELSALFHDIKRGGKDHGLESARLALSWLDGEVDVEKLDEICYCIEVHNKVSKPYTLEAQILQDADKLDGLGALGLVRIIAFATLQNLELCDEEKPFGEDYEGNMEKWLEYSMGRLPERFLKMKEFLFEKIINEQIQWVPMLWTKEAKEIASRKYNFMLNFLKECEYELRK